MAVDDAAARARKNAACLIIVEAECRLRKQKIMSGCCRVPAPVLCNNTLDMTKFNAQRRN